MATWQNLNDPGEIGWQEVGGELAQVGIPGFPQASTDQIAAFETITARVIAGERNAALAGPAGSGKTTMLMAIIAWAKEQGRTLHIAAPTNKAALRATEVTGVGAVTVHTLAAERPFTDEETGDLLGFVWRERLGLAPGSILLFDEASMIGRRLVERLNGIVPEGISMIFVGDPYQLPPVKDDDNPLLLDPHAELTTVHRQGAGSLLLEHATYVRTRKVHVVPALLQQWGEKLHHPSLKQFGQAIASGAYDQVLVSRNKTRWAVNEAVRRAQHKPALQHGPMKGDKVAAITTERVREERNGGEGDDGNRRIVNGEQGVVVFAKEGFPVAGQPIWYVKVDWGAPVGVKAILVPKDCWCPPGVEPWRPDAAQKAVSRLREEWTTTPIVGLQAAWAITVHKCQGSEARRGAVVLDGWIGPRKWRASYTAITRFMEKLDYISLSEFRAADGRRGRKKEALNRLMLTDPPPISEDDPCFYDL